MNIIDEYFKLQKIVHGYFGYVGRLENNTSK